MAILRKNLALCKAGSNALNKAQWVRNLNLWTDSLTQQVDNSRENINLQYSQSAYKDTSKTVQNQEKTCLLSGKGSYHFEKRLNT
jgi:hypothetical protein